MNLKSDIHILNTARLCDLFLFAMFFSVTWKKLEMNTDQKFNQRVMKAFLPFLNQCYYIFSPKSVFPNKNEIRPNEVKTAMQIHKWPRICKCA